MATESQVFVLVQVTVNAPLIRVSLVTRNWYSCQCECSLTLGRDKFSSIDTKPDRQAHSLVKMQLICSVTYLIQNVTYNAHNAQ